MFSWETIAAGSNDRGTMELNILINGDKLNERSFEYNRDYSGNHYSSVHINTIEILYKDDYIEIVVTDSDTDTELSRAVANASNLLVKKL